MENLTVYDVMVLASEHYVEIEKVWLGMDEGKTLLEATVEWARLQGREICVIGSK